VYRGLITAETDRMKAAIAALPFERPKLAVTANLNVMNFAEEIEAAMIRSGKPLIIGGAKPTIPARR
jgi:hypothetical protein